MEQRKYCVVGYPIMHSKSPELFEEIFRQRGAKNCSYDKVELCSGEELAVFFEKMRAGAYCGCNVTMPLKTDAAGMLDGLTREAEALCAVNSVVCRDGRLFGHSTDGGGMCRAIEAAGQRIKGKKTVLLGSGGAARSVAAAVLGSGCESLTIICRQGRNRELMQAMLQRYNSAADGNEYAVSENILMGGRKKEDGGITVCSFIEYRDSRAAGTAIAEADILINATSIGMSPDSEECALPEGAGFHMGLLAADAVYNPVRTVFLKRAEEAGCITVNGLEMLRQQADLAADFFGI